MPSKTNLTIVSSKESDIPRLVEIQFSAFEGDPYQQAFYPGPDSPASRAKAERNTLKEWREEPFIHVIKCVDSTTGVIAGFAIWNIFDRERSREEWGHRPAVDWLDTEQQRKVAETFLYANLAIRERIWEGRCYVLLSLLCVHKDYQRQGVGTRLVQWGLDKASELGLPAHLEASPAGALLYPKLGFHRIETLVIKAEDVAREKDVELVVMLRPYAG